MDFSIAVEEKGEVSRDINIEIPRSLYKEKYNQVLNKVAKTAKIKGFRPGHVPVKMVDQMYGARVHDDVLQDLVSKAYSEAVKKHELKVVGYPKLDFASEDLRTSQEDLNITASVSIVPEPKIKNYFGVKADVEVEEFDESLVEKQISNILDQFASIEVDKQKKVVKKDSIITADTEGTVDGEPFGGSGGEDVIIEVNSDKLPEGFAEGIIGMKVGEDRTISTKLPEDVADQKLAGKEAIYKITCKAINKKIVPELTDELVKEKKLGESVEAFKTDLEKNLKEQTERSNKVAKDEAVFKVLIEKNKFEVPEAMIDEQIREILFNMRFLDRNKEESYQMDMSRFRQAFAEQAEFQVRRAVIIEQVIAQEDFSVDEKDVEAWLQDQAKEFSAEIDKVKQMYGYPENIERLQNNLARERICEKLVDEASLKEKPKSKEEEKKS